MKPPRSTPTACAVSSPSSFGCPTAERGRVYDLVRELRREVYPGVWFAELLALESDVARGLLDRDEIRQAAGWYLDRLSHLKKTGAANDPAANEPTWFRRVFARLPESVNQGSAARILHAIWELVRPDEEVKNLPAFPRSRSAPAVLESRAPDRPETGRGPARRHIVPWRTSRAAAEG